LLGQWTRNGKRYELENSEEITGIRVTTIKPLYSRLTRPGLSQVSCVFLYINQRVLEFDTPGDEYARSDAEKASDCGGQPREVTWEYNAIFDRVWSL
jgi:hypothetical protein